MKYLILIFCLFASACSFGPSALETQAVDNFSRYRASKAVLSVAPTELRALDLALKNYQDSGSEAAAKALELAMRNLDNKLADYGLDLSAEDKFQVDFMQEQRQLRQNKTPAKISVQSKS